MTEDERGAYLELRAGARTVLGKLGVPSNPAVDDEWIISLLREQAELESIQDYEGIQGDDYRVFLNCICQVIRELGGEVPEPDGRGAVLEARRLVHRLSAAFVQF